MRATALLVVVASLLAGCAGVFGLDEVTYVPDDRDSDDVPDAVDNCVDTANPDQADADADGHGDACEGFCVGTCEDDPGNCACLDFDDGQVPAPWTLNMAGGSVADIWSQDAVSPALSYRMFHAASTTGVQGSSYVALTRGITTSRRRVTLEYTLKLPPIEVTNAYTNMELASVATTASRIASKWLYDSETDAVIWLWDISYIDEDGMFQSASYVISAPPTGVTKWVQVRVEALFAPDTTGYFVISYDGVEALRVPNVRTSGPASDTATVSGTVGIGTSAGLTPNVTLYHDNVVFRALAE